MGGATHPGRLFDLTVTISIHAPRGGSDCDEVLPGDTVSIFQSTLPVGGATIIPMEVILSESFQSTLPVGGATVSSRVLALAKIDFNPRSPWGERLIISCTVKGRYNFNPRSPWGERQHRAKGMCY